MTYKYDVFISYSRKDYKDEATKAEIPGNPITAITEAFDKNNISYWIDREGIYSGQEFRDKIIDAIATSSVFLFVSSHNSNQSIWTKREILEASDSGKYIIPFKIDDCEYDRSVKFELRPLDFIEYFSDKEGALQDLVRSVNQYKEELAKEEKKQLEAKLKAEITEKIRTLEEDFKISVQRHEVTLKEILELHAKLGTTTKICPICDKKVPLETTFCERCGWQFPALLSSDVDRKLLTLLKANWKIINTATTSKDEIKALKNENLELKETIDNISKELEKSQKEKAQMADEKAILNTQILDLTKELEKSQKEKSQIAEEKAILNTLIQDLTKELEKSKKEKTQIAEEKALLNTQIQDLAKELEKSQKENIQMAEEKAMLNTQILGLAKELEKSQKENARIADEKAMINIQIRDLTKKLEKSQKENVLIAEEKAMLNTQIQELKDQIRDLYYQINEKDKLSQKTNLQISELTFEFESKEKEYKSTIAHLESIKAELTKKCEDLTPKKKIPNKDYIFNTILPVCRDINTYIFSSDSKSVIQLTKLTELLKKDYGIHLSQYEINQCKIVSDIVNLIARKANVN